MAQLDRHEILSLRSLMIIHHAHPEARVAINEYAGRMLELLRAKYLKAQDWNERQATAIEKEMADLIGEEKRR